MFFKKISNKYLLLFLIIAIGIILRILNVLSFGDFLFDEMVSLAIAKKPFWEMWDYLKIEMHPPAHFYYLSFWVKIFGDSEIIVRLSSVFTSALFLVSSYFLSEEIFNSRKISLFITILLSFSSYMIYWSVVGRMYIFLALFSVLSFLFFLKIIKNKSFRFINHFFYILFTLLALYSHLTAGIIIFIQLVFILFFNLKFFKKIFFDWSIVVLLYLPWFLFFVLKKLVDIKGNAWYFVSTDFNDILLYPFKFVLMGNYYIPRYLFIFLSLFIFIILISCLFKRFDKISIKKIILPLLIFFISFFSLIFLHLNSFRYFIISGIGFIFLLGYFFSLLDYKKFINIILIITLFLLMTDSFFLNLNFKSISWSKGFEFIEQNEKVEDLIVFSHDTQTLSAIFYYHGNLEVKSISESKGNDKIKQAINNSIYPSSPNKNLDKLIDISTKHNRIFLLESADFFTEDQIKTKEWFLKKGYKIEKKGDFNKLKVFLLSL